MLRKTVVRHKTLPCSVPPLYKSVEKEVQVDVKDFNGEVITSRTEIMHESRSIDKGELLKHEPADLYSIENLQAAGVRATVCPTSGYIHKGIDALPEVEAASADLLYQTEQKAAQKASKAPKTEPESNVENPAE